MIKKIALVAHDARKQELVSWVKFNAGSLKECELFCTGTTGRLIEAALREVLGDEAPVVTKLLSGPLGGDAQIGSMIAEDRVDMLVFFCDNLIMQGHQNDVMSLVRLASLLRKDHPCLHRIIQKQETLTWRHSGAKEPKPPMLWRTLR